MEATERSQPLRALAAPAAILAVLCALLCSSLFGGKVLTQADALQQFPPWSAVAAPGAQPSNPLLLDQSIVFLPWMGFAAQRLRAGELPLWNPDNYLGQPFVGTYQSALYWPLNWVYYALPSWHVHAWTALARLFAAALFARAFLRRLGACDAAASIGGLGYCLSGFFIAWLNHAHTNVALFLPALFWSIERMAARPSRRESALFGLLFGLQLLAGHVQTSLHIALAAAAWALLRTGFATAAPRLARGGLLRLAGGALLGLLLAAPQLLPFAEYLADSQGARVLEQLDVVDRAAPAEHALLMIAPAHYGAPHTHDYRGPLGHNLNYNELIGAYVGRTLLALAVLQLLWLGWRGPRRGLTLALAGLVAIALLVGWQIDPFYSLARALPRLRSTKLMRVLVIAAFGLSALGALGLDALLQRLAAQAALARALALGVFALVAFELLSFARGYNPEVDAAGLVPRTRVTDFLASEPRPMRVIGVDNRILLPNANLFYGLPMISGYDSIEYRRVTELELRMTNARPSFPFVSRITAYDRSEALPLASLLGVTHFLAEGDLPAPLELALDAELEVYRNPLALPRVFVARAVELVAEPEQRLARLGAADFDPRVALLERDSAELRRAQAAQRPGAEPGTSRVTLYEPRTLEAELELERPALVVVADAFAPGWHASLIPQQGGAARELAIERVDHALRGVWVDPGRWKLRMHYAPASTRIGLALAALGALLALGLACTRTRTPAR